MSKHECLLITSYYGLISLFQQIQDQYEAGNQESQNRLLPLYQQLLVAKQKRFCYNQVAPLSSCTFVRPFQYTSPTTYI